MKIKMNRNKINCFENMSRFILNIKLKVILKKEKNSFHCTDYVACKEKTFFSVYENEN